MEEFIARLGWKKLAALLIIFGIVLMLPIVTSFLPTKAFKKTSRVDTIVSPTPITGNSAAHQGWARYDSGFFQIDYPPSWWITTPQAKVGVALFMQQLSSAGDLFPRIDIHAWFDTKGDRLDKTAQTVSTLNFQRSSTSFLGRKVMRFEKDLALNTSSGASRVVKKIIYLFEEKGLVYEIDYGYYKDDISGEKMIRDILSTFSLK